MVAVVVAITALKHQKSGENSAKISVSGQTCGQRRKTGLFNPQSREEQARYGYCENTRFREDLRENKRKTRVRYEPSFWSECNIAYIRRVRPTNSKQDLNLRPLPPQRRFLCKM